MHVGSYRMWGAMHSKSSNELGSIFVEPIDGRHRIGARGENTIYLLMVVDTNFTYGLNGSKVVL